MEGEQRRHELEELEKEGEVEWQSYIKEVFEPVFARLQSEIAELYKMTADVEKLLHTSVAGERALSAAERTEDVAMVDVLRLFLRVHELQEEREREVGKAVAERNRRYKKNVVRTLYRKGDIPEMKRVEAGLDQSEKKAEAGRCGARLDKCKPVWKMVKTAVRKGVDENEKSANEILDAVESIGAAAASSTERGAGDAIKRAKTVLAELAASSTSLMRLFEQVDNLLNDAEFEIMVAQERCAGATADVFADLETQKREQDGVLRQEAVSREKGVEKALKEWEGVLDKASGALTTGAKAAKGGKEAGKSEEEVEKERRLKAALEAARRRNGES
jgi:hypothetical protein